MKKLRISELPKGGSLKGLRTIGVDDNNRSVSVSLEFVEDKAEAAQTAANSANNAAQDANTAKTAANTAAALANENAGKAIKSANDAEAAAISATGAAQDANSAKEACIIATGKTETATENAITATSEAQTSAQVANDAASNVRDVLDGIDEIVEDQLSYGVQRDMNISSASCTRIGSASLHRICPIQSRMRGCLLDDNGKVIEYLDPQGWEDHSRDGSQGQVMVEVPAHFRKFGIEGTAMSVRISELQLPGYHFVPKMYVSAYEASWERSTNKLCSVVNDSVDFRGGNNNASNDGTYKTLLGRPVTSKSRTAFRNAARKRNESETAEWNCMTYDAQKAIYWLFVVEYATLNTQAGYNAEPTSEGFHQGGLGAGVTNLTSAEWSDFNGSYPFVPCGYTDSLGNNTGVIDYLVENDDKSISKVVSVPRYRGLENPFGHIWQWTDGINIRISANEADGGDGLSKVFVCSDPAKFNDTNYDGYSYVGDEARENGYVKEVIFGEYGEIMPMLVGGGSSTYFCDYHYTNIPASGESLRGVLFGGQAHYGASAGFAYAYSHNAPSRTDAYFGSRLCFLPISDK